MASRDGDFSSEVARVVRERVAGLCSNPECRAQTLGPHEDDGAKSLTVGECAHIRSASKAGPRHDPSWSLERLASAENALWLCRNCHKPVDAATSTYRVELLQLWKAAAEYAALEARGKTAGGAATSTPAINVGTNYGQVAGGNIVNEAPPPRVLRNIPAPFVAAIRGAAPVLVFRHADDGETLGLVHHLLEGFGRLGVEAQGVGVWIGSGHGPGVTVVAGDASQHSHMHAVAEWLRGQGVAAAMGANHRFGKENYVMVGAR